jgi:glycosyltransferase involved in cell wall biosynthesis
MKRALFIQVTEPGGYPPLVNAAHLMVEAGWQVTFISAPIAGSKLKMPVVSGIQIVAMPERPSHVVTKLNYLQYCARAVTLSLRIKPHVVYVSDPVGAFPGVLAAKVSGARLVYHEHDSPNSEVDLNGLVRRARRVAFDLATLIVFPNAERARLAKGQCAFDAKKLRVVWNAPRLAELPALRDVPDTPFILYYHGSINPERLPETVLAAVASFSGKVRLDVAGYEAPGAKGYVERLMSRWNCVGHEVVRYLGEQPHGDLLRIAAGCNAGLVLMPPHSEDVNMMHMVGASNKAFDYMAAGLPLIVSALSEWRETFVDEGYGLACDPTAKESVKASLHWLVANQPICRAMSKSCRSKIESDWNYDALFRPVLDLIS